LEVGRTSTVDVKLTVAKAGEIVTVQIQEAQVDLTQSEVQGLVTSNTSEASPKWATS